MEKEYNSKLIKAAIVLLVFASPFGLFLYAFFTIIKESVMGFTPASFDHISFNDFSFSIIVSLISTLGAVAIGSIFSFYVQSNGRQNFKYGILNIVLVLPHLGFAYIIYLFFSDQGFLYRTLALMGLNIEFSLINDRLGIGIIINYLLKEIPFVILYLLATHKDELNGHIIAAKDLGASFFEIFFKIYLPLNMLQIMSISIVIFAFVMGNYEVPFLLGANGPQFLSVSALENFQSIDLIQNNVSYLKVIIIFLITILISLALRVLVRYSK